jgi:hypothetical protein
MDTEISICTDCAMLAANGELAEVSDCEPLGLVDGYVAVTCSGGDCDEHFSWSPCEGCGSRLGGYRHSAVVLTV